MNVASSGHDYEPWHSCGAQWVDMLRCAVWAPTWVPWIRIVIILVLLIILRKAGLMA
jgi:hypothetical protein